MPHLSASQLDTFVNCPKKWVANYILQTKGEPSEALGLGGAFHETLEIFGRSRIQRRSGTTDLAAMQREFSIILRRVMSEQDPHGTLLKAHALMEQKGHAMLEGFCTHIAHRFWPIAVEEEFSFDIPGMKPYNGEPWTVTGRIDARTVLPETGGTAIVDWKTGKAWKPGAEDDKLQATIYLLSDLLRGLPISQQVTFITFPLVWQEAEGRFTCTPDIRVTKRTLKQISDMVQLLRSSALRINALRDNGGITANPTPSYLCPYCPRYSSCFAGQEFMFSKGRLNAITVDENDQPLIQIDLSSRAS